MTSYFCLGCGIKTEGNTKVGITKDFILECPCCGMTARFYVLNYATKTAEEIDKAFQDTPLTDSQRGVKKRKGNAAKL